MKMIQEASPRPDDVCEIEGEAINDVSNFCDWWSLSKESAFSEARFCFASLLTGAIFDTVLLLTLLFWQIIIVGRVTNKIEEAMRTSFEINDNTGTFKVIFYQKGENEVPIALKNFDYQ